MQEFKLTPAKVARSLNKSTKAVIRLIHRGELAAIKFRRSYRISEEDVSTFLLRARVVPTSECSESFVSAVADFEHQKAEHYCEDENT
jgi:excisionase family DNA binding protein